MKERVVSGFFIAVLIVVLALTGGFPLGLVLMVCSLIGYDELMRACGVTRDSARVTPLTAVGFGSTVLLYGALLVLSITARGAEYAEASDFWMILVVVLDLLVSMGVYVLTFPRYEWHQVVTGIFGFLYCPVLMSFILRARCLGRYGIFIYALIFICSSVCDTCAWAVGRAIGRHKMAPVLSPKKTLEGAAGGLAGSALVCWLASLLLEYFYPEMHMQLEFLLLGICGGLISMIGDLAASAIKRNRGIKDYGHLIPGHGGIMDRFDSIIFTAPVIYFLAVLLIGVV